MPEEGLRLNKYLSLCAVCSRREADRHIAAGRISVFRDGRELPAEVGMRILPGDRVCLDGVLVGEPTEKVYLLFHKPKGLICTKERREERNLFRYLREKISFPENLTYAGRLDGDSSGLLLLTNDGELIQDLMRASNRHEKEYCCRVTRPLTLEFLHKMRTGVDIVLPDADGSEKKVRTRPCRVVKTGERTFSIVLTQGLNRQIRRMCAALGYRVASIERVRIENLVSDGLAEGELRQLTEEERRTLKERVLTGKREGPLGNPSKAERCSERER